MGEDEPLNSAMLNAIERLIDAKMWVAKVSHNDTTQLFHASNELQGARHELAKLLEEPTHE